MINLIKQKMNKINIGTWIQIIVLVTSIIGGYAVLHTRVNYTENKIDVVSVKVDNHSILIAETQKDIQFIKEGISDIKQILRREKQ
jgi:hypothetical protein